MPTITYIPTGLPPLVFSTVPGRTGPREYLLLPRYEGFGAPGADIQTTRSPGMHGSRVTAVLATPREMVIEVLALGETATETAQKVALLMQAVNPLLGPGALIFLARQGGVPARITALPHPPLLDMTPAGRTPTVQKITLVFVAHDPFFSIPPAHAFYLRPSCTPTFPLFLDGDVFSLAQREAEAVINYTGGDVPAPVALTCYGHVVNVEVSVENAAGSAAIRFELAIESAQYVQLQSGPGLQAATLFSNGRVENAMPGVSLDSTFWLLQPGENRIFARADSADGRACVKIEWNDRISQVI